MNTALAEVMVRVPMASSFDKRVLRATVVSRDGDKMNIVPTEPAERDRMIRGGRKSIEVWAQDTTPVHPQAMQHGQHGGGTITKMYPTNDQALANRQW